MKKHGPFLIYDWTKCAKEQTMITNVCEGTMISKNGYKHTRRN